MKHIVYLISFHGVIMGVKFPKDYKAGREKEQNRRLFGDITMKI